MPGDTLLGRYNDEQVEIVEIIAGGAAAAGILLATVGLAGALASPAVSAADSVVELFDGRLPNNSQHAHRISTTASQRT